MYALRGDIDILILSYGFRQERLIEAIGRYIPKEICGGPRKRGCVYVHVLKAG